VRNVAQRERTRRKKLFFRKKQKSKIKIKGSQKKEKMQKVESKSFREILSLEKEIAEAKTLAIFSTALNLPRSPVQPVTEIPDSFGTFDVPRYIFPLMRPPYMKRLSPSFLNGPTFLWAQSRTEEEL
jgi:hypothetical protein